MQGLIHFFCQKYTKWLIIMLFSAVPNALIYASPEATLTDKTDSLLIQAQQYKIQKKFSLSLNCYFQALTETNNPATKHLINTEIGTLYYDYDLFEKALYYYLKADTNYLSSDPVKFVTYLKNVAGSYEKIGDHANAYFYYNNILRLFQKNSQRRHQAAIYVKLSELCKKQNKYDEAIQHELKNLVILEQLRDTSGLAVSFNNIGTLYRHIGEYRQAKDFLLYSYNIKQHTRDFSGLAITCINISVICQLLAEYDESLKFLLQAYNLQKTNYEKASLAHTCNLIAWVYFHKKNYFKAESYSLEAELYAKELKLFEILEASYRMLSAIHNYQGNATTALNYYQKYSEIKDTLTSIQNNKQQSLLAKHLDIQNKEAKIKDLMIEKELNEFILAKLQFEKEKKEKDLELFIKESDLKEVRMNWEKLQKEKAINLYKLNEERLRADVNEKELTLLKQKEAYLENEKQNKIRELKAQSEISTLKLSQKESEIQMQKLWNYIYLSVFIILLVIGLLLFKRYKLKQKEAELRLKSRNIEIEQKFLRSQMNPHFIFNSLNSIQSFVTQNESYAAEKYLAKFSRLMRHILEYSGQSYISIEKEINTLKLYLQLQQLRFDNKFDFIIEADPAIDCKNTVIPPMITQPFVENSILHGFINKTDKGTITIKFIRNDAQLELLVIDNGVGRNASKEQTDNKRKKHNSMGMQVTRDRLELLNEMKGLKYGAEIIDLKDENERPAGTMVKILLEYKEMVSEDLAILA